MTRKEFLVESPQIYHNALGDPYSVKLLYPNCYLEMELERLTIDLGFPISKERLAKKVLPGHLFFVYITSPERRVIGLTTAGTHAQFMPEKDFKRPWNVIANWVIGPKYPGVSWEEIGIVLKQRIGDSTYAITEGVAAKLIERLQEMPDLDQAQLAKLKERYSLLA